MYVSFVMQFLKLLLLVTGFVECIAAPQNHKPRIIDGTDVFGDGFPYLVSIHKCRLRQCEHSCGGTIVSPRAVVTAAHCTDDARKPSISLKIVAGVKNLMQSNTGRQETYVTSFSVHPMYYSNNTYVIHDIAVLHLSTKLHFTSLVQPAKLPKQGYYPRGFGTVVGWGATSPNIQNPLPSLQLQALSVPIIPDIYKCAGYLPRIYQASLDFHGGNVCTYTPGGASVCDGDSGGPLKDSSNDFVGIASWTHKPCGTLPNVYVNVGHYVSFLKSKIRDLA